MDTVTSSPEYTQQQRCQEDHDEDEEQDLRDFGCTTCDSAEAEKRRDDRDDEKDDSVSKHEALQRGRLSDWFACWLDAFAALTALHDHVPLNAAISRDART
jgi:hypothetical protein